MLLSLVLCLALAGCVPETKSIHTDTFGEFVGDTYWVVTYDTDTKKIVSIATMIDSASVQIDEPSEVRDFVTAHCGESVPVTYGWRYSGVPLGNNRYSVSQVYVYDFYLGTATFEEIRAAYPNAELQTSTTGIMDVETGVWTYHEVHSVEIIDHKTEPIEMELVFSNLPA